MDLQPFLLNALPLLDCQIRVFTLKCPISHIELIGK